MKLALGRLGRPGQTDGRLSFSGLDPGRAGGVSGYGLCMVSGLSRL
jgi:hypothetical protein